VANQSTYAIITGASTGIGRAISLDLALRGYNVILIARNESLLAKLAEEIKTKNNVDAIAFPADLSERGTARKIYDFCTANNIQVSILVNNAGYAVFGLFDVMSLDEQLDMVQVNNIAMISLTHAFIPILKNQPKAWIMNIASTSAFQAVPAMSLYAASKALVITFTRGLQMELADTGIHVCCVIPGPTSSNFIDRAKMVALKEMAAKFEWPAEKVAKIAVKGMFAGAIEVIPGMMNKVSYIFIKLMPKRVAEKIAANIYLKAVKKSK
jgi:uncharacterized protein